VLSKQENHPIIFLAVFKDFSTSGLIMEKSGLNNQNVARKFRNWLVFFKSGLKEVQNGLNLLIGSCTNASADQTSPLDWGPLRFTLTFQDLC
jgi:hypothetical protein